METLDSTAAWKRGSPPEEAARDAAAWEVVPHRLSGQQCLRSRRAFAAGETLASFGAAAVEDRPSRMTVQVSEREHITLAPPSLSFMNHGCAPCVHLDVVERRVVALRPIAAGDELTFFYPSTEWAMASPFDCHCGSARCVGRIAGASQVPAGLLRGRLLAPHVVRLLRRNGAP